MSTTPILTLAFGVAAVLATGCGPLGLDDTPVRIRVHNASGIALAHVRFESGPTQLAFDSLPPSTQTQYTEVQASYRYGFVQAVIGTDTLRNQVIDYVGETYIEPGDYTVTLSILSGPDGQTHLAHVMRRDE